MNTIKYFFMDLKQFIIFLIKYHRKNSMFFVDLFTRQQRLNECNTCPYLKTTKFFNYKRCGVCGCFLTFKTKLSFEECPLVYKRWGMVKSESR